MSYIPTSAYEPGFPPAWEGLDYASAETATPRLYAVSSGNGNDGVSHLYPDYYVKTCDPWRLAELAMVSSLKSDYREWAIEHCEVDGEAEYTISAVIYNPPDDGDDRNMECRECGCAMFITDDGIAHHLDDSPTGIDHDADEDHVALAEESSSWSDANGAWIIVDVFPVDETNGRALAYTSLSDAFDADMLALIPAE